jgi:hypothetical protein
MVTGRKRYCQEEICRVSRVLATYCGSVFFLGGGEGVLSHSEVACLII